MHSGFALNPWAFQPNPRANALKLAKILGCVSESLDEIVKFLLSALADDIVEATKKMVDYKVSMDSIIFSPSVEAWPGSESSLPDTPEALMKRGDFVCVPVILGCCVREGVVAAYQLGEGDFEKMNTNHESLVPSMLGLRPGSAEESEAAKEIWDFYFRGKSLSWDNINDYLLYESDLQFSFGMEQTRTYLLKNSSAPVYTYLFTNHSRCMLTAMKFPYPEHESKVKSSDTCHCDDFGYLYSFNLLGTPELIPEYKDAIIRHVKTWTHFASTGDPNNENLTVTWRKDSATNPRYMDIGTTWKMKEGLPLPDRMEFWKNLVSKYCTV
ncbi:hypothetical protein J6590_071807 [Homalodisca vitripennis]|nr:hypothetical protein J6590_071807 [Homalodisca vitripennis]